jgi:hypothetical protein
VAAAVHEINNLDLYQWVLGLHSDIIELVEDNNRLRDENKVLKEAMALTKKMIHRPPFFYQDGDPSPFLSRLLGRRAEARVFNLQP